MLSNATTDYPTIYCFDVQAYRQLTKVGAIAPLSQNFIEDRMLHVPQYW